MDGADSLQGSRPGLHQPDFITRGLLIPACVAMETDRLLEFHLPGRQPLCRVVAAVDGGVDPRGLQKRHGHATPGRVTEALEFVLGRPPDGLVRALRASGEDGFRLRLLGIGLSRLQPADAVQLSLAL